MPRRRAASWCAALAAALVAAAPQAGAQPMTATPQAVSSAGAGAVTLRVSVAHDGGPQAIRTVAAEITGPDAGASYPKLYDDGTHGDAQAGDGTWSITAPLPAGAGEHAVVFYVVDVDGVEVVTPPLAFTVE